MILHKDAMDPNFGHVYTISNEIVATPFWTEEFCKTLVNYLNQNQQLFLNDTNDTPDYGGPYDSYFLNLDKFDNTFTQEFRSHYYDKVFPFLRSVGWVIPESTKLVCPFFLRYSIDTCCEMKSHSDFGIASLNIKLNNDHEGCDLFFPRQNYTNKNLPIGWALFWPGSLTHPHYTDMLQSGTRYSLTMFTYNPIVPNPSYGHI